MQREGPLSNVRVIDFTWAAMGPYAGYLLACLGAEVIQVSRPVRGTKSTTAAITQFFDVGKTCVQIDVKHDAGKRILKSLIGKADIFLENFRPGVVENLGLDFETVSENNPKLVMISGSALGRGGAESGYVGYAPIFSALSGLADETGFEDGPPTEIRYPCDLTSGALMAFAAIAGVAKARNGAGAYVDLAARDALLWTLTSSLGLGKQDAGRLGNGHETMFPHNVFPCQGRDQWVAIAARDDQQRRALYRLVGWSEETETDVSALNSPDREKIEAAIATWTSSRTTDEAVSGLQACGVAVFASVDARDIWNDDHLRARNAFQYVEGVGWVAGPPWALEGGRGQIMAARNGADARRHVFQDILGLDPAQIDDLVQQNILG